MSGRYIPGREDCERVPSRICSGELLLHPTMANRRIPKWKMFLLDSGAFTFMHGIEASSKPVDWDGYLSRYIDFINRNNVQHFFELDVDSIVGYDAVKRMRARLEAETGKQSIPVWHRSRGLDEFKRLCRDYPISHRRLRNQAHTAQRVRLYPSFGAVCKFLRGAGAWSGVHQKGCSEFRLLQRGQHDMDHTGQFRRLSYFNGTEMVVVRPPKGMIGADYRRRREYSLREWIKYQKYLDTKGKWRG